MQRTHFTSSGLLPNCRKLYKSHNWFPHKREGRPCFPQTGLKHSTLPRDPTYKNVAFLFVIAMGERGRGSSQNLHTFCTVNLWAVVQPTPSPTPPPPPPPPLPHPLTALLPSPSHIPLWSTRHILGGLADILHKRWHFH